MALVNSNRFLHTCKNILVDALSIVIFLAILYICAQGFTTLYTAYYNTGKITPDVFQLASTQFTGAIGLFYTLLLTRKHYSPSAPAKSKESEGSKGTCRLLKRIS